MIPVDCAILYEWEYDQEFVSVLNESLERRGISCSIVRPGEFERVHEELIQKRISFGVIVDRASDVDENCELIVRLLAHRGSRIINDPGKVRHASDKASMHLEFITAGLNVPYTIIISPYTAERDVRLGLTELAQLGRPFIIKPANTTGGGIGVVTGAENLHDVIVTRQHHKDDKYLLQQKIEPASFDGRRAWFRPFYVFGEVLLCWWDDQTHVYFPVTSEETRLFNLHEVESIVRRIFDVCGLEFFSTEIAATPEGKFVVIDYVNEMCDMRLKSRHPDGVPDETVAAVADKLAAGIHREIRKV